MNDTELRVKALDLAVLLLSNDWIGEEDHPDYGSTSHMFEVSTRIFNFYKGVTPNE